MTTIYQSESTDSRGLRESELRISTSGGPTGDGDSEVAVSITVRGRPLVVSVHRAALVRALLRPRDLVGLAPALREQIVDLLTSERDAITEIGGAR